MLENIIGIELELLLIIWGIVIFAAVLRAFTGFGFALAAVPAFSQFLSPTASVVLSTSLIFLISLVSIKSYWGVVPLRPMLPLCILLIIGTGIGTMILTLISKNQFQLGVGLSVILACIGLLFLKPSTNWKSPFFTLITGLTSGIMNGAVAISGPPMIIYAMITEPDPKNSRAWLMTILGFAALFGLIAFGMAGFINQQTMWYSLLAFPALYIGNYLGTFLFEQYGNALYRKVAILVLVVIGVSMTAKALF